DAPEAFAALWGQWGVRQLQGNATAALALGEELLARAQASGDDGWRLQAHHALWPTHIYRGEFVAAIENIEAGLALYDVDRHRSLAFTFGGHDARACGLSFKTLALWAMSAPREAR